MKDDLLAPRILVVDDERQIHASVRLRLAKGYDVVCSTDPHEALQRITAERFDLCIVDIHMPVLDGLRFIAMAQERDPALGYVVLSAFDTDENLRRAIPLNVYEFLPKPLPQPSGFEQRVPEWVERTRSARHRLLLAEQAGSLAQDLDSARLERDVELVASESARDALLQTAGLLTTIHAHLVTATTALASRVRSDPSFSHLLRCFEEARKTSDAAVTVAEGFFDSAYGNRDSSAALVNAGIRHATQIAMRITKAEQANKTIDLGPIDERIALPRLSGIDVLLLMTPALALALTITGSHTTVGVRVEQHPRIEAVLKDHRARNHLWVNRKLATPSHSGVSITVTAAGPALTRSEAEAWLKGAPSHLAKVTARGLVIGIQKCRGLLGLALTPADESFRLVFAIPDW